MDERLDCVSHALYFLVTSFTVCSVRYVEPNGVRQHFVVGLASK